MPASQKVVGSQNLAASPATAGALETPRTVVYPALPLEDAGICQGDRTEADMRRLWPAGVALALAVLLAAAFQPDSPASRVSNLRLGDGPFRDTYIIVHRTRDDRCFVVDRRDATRRRSDDNQPGRRWTCLSIPGVGADAPDTWFVHSKRKGKGSVFFVPAQDVADWSYPLLYEFVREKESQAEAPELPSVEWTQLYVSRIDQGLYLRVKLPFDLRKKDGGSGVLRELLVVEGNRVSTLDTRFDGAPGIYSESVADARLPELAAPSPQLAWLAARAPTPGTTLLMSNEAPHEVRLLPLPISLRAIYRAKSGRSPATFLDDRLKRFSEGSWRSAGQGPPPFDAAERAELERRFREYWDALGRALVLDAIVRETPAPHEEWRKRQASLSDLQIEPGEL